MCGITGQYNFASGAPVDRGRLEDMTRSIRHRGPDDEGFYFSDSLGFGFRRLSILDLSEAGHQPMSDSTGRYWIVFNGEIYNFKELRSELESLGRQFRSTSDTEVIIEGYAEWGDEILNKLNGMFGIAIWNEPEKRLLLARDPMGIKPVYYTIENGTLIFGSEIRCVRAGKENPPGFDSQALSLFLRYRYTPAPATAYEGISKLAPGERLVVENGQVRINRWYEFTPTPFPKEPSDEEAAETLLELYRAAVKRHLISDVPVGLLLSGGIDSGLLLGLMSEHGKDWPTFTVGYGANYKNDELIDAADTARCYNSRHTEVRIDRDSFEENLPKIIESLEEPVATSSIVPMYFVCKRAREDVKVVLIGQGPDELLGGYTRHLGVAYSSLWRMLPSVVQSPLIAAANALPRSESIKRGAYSLGVADRLRRYQQVFSIVPGETIDSIFQPGILPANSGDAVLDYWSVHRRDIDHLDELGGFQLLELRSSLADELLMYGDKLSMAHSLEGRVPFLDRTIVEYVQRLPARFKVRAGQRKWLHRNVCRKYLSAETIKRKKRGFAHDVVDDWFRSSMKGKIDSVLRDHTSEIFQILDSKNVASLLDDHRSGVTNNSKLLFSLVVLEEWLRSQRS